MFPQNENRNKGTFGCSPKTENRNEGTFACSPGTKTGTRVDSPKPPFYETALLSPGDESRDNPGTTRRLITVKSLYFLCFEANT